MERTIKKLTADNWKFEKKLSELLEKVKIKESDIVSITQSRGTTSVWFWADKQQEDSHQDLWEGIEW